MGQQIRTARKQHRCDDCFKVIAVGARYADERHRSAPGQAFRFCLRCAEARRTYVDKTSTRVLVPITGLARAPAWVQRLRLDGGRVIAADPTTDDSPMDQQIRTAHKQYRCESCFDVIAIGARYADERYRSAPGQAFRFCLHCAEARRVQQEEHELHQECMDAVEGGWDGHKEWL